MTQEESIEDYTGTKLIIKIAFMTSGEYRRSARLSELDAQKAKQAKSQNGANGTSQLEMVQDSGPKRDSCQKFRRKRKTRPVQDLVDTSVNCQVLKVPFPLVSCAFSITFFYCIKD